MILKRLVQWAALTTLALATVGCAGGSSAPAETWAALDAVPDGAQCVHVVADGAADEQVFDVSGGTPALLHVDELATGQLSAVAFAVDCDAVAAGSDVVPDWTSDATMVQPSAAGVGRVTLTLHDNHDHGHKHHCHGDHGHGGGSADGGVDGGAADDKPRVERVDYHGSGCAAGTVIASISPDQEAATVGFSAYIASAGPGVDASEQKKRCNLDFRIHVPQGKMVAVTNIDYRGFVHLDDAVSAALKTHVGFKDGSGQDRDTQHFAGVVDQDYQMHDEVKISTVAWSPCGGKRTLDVDSSVVVDNSKNPMGTAMLTVDSVDDEVKQTYHLSWKSCP
jgi:hypothetical protein